VLILNSLGYHQGVMSQPINGRQERGGGRYLDRFQLLRVIGRGGMGEVWLARDTKLGRDVAIKVLSSSQAGLEAQHRFEREIRSLAALNHPTIAQIYEAGEAVWHDDDGCERHVPYLVMEYVQGETLSRCLDRGPMPVREAITIICKCLEGLAVAHDRYLVHRDIKPSNIVVNDDGEVKLLDLGLARLVALDEYDDYEQQVAESSGYQWDENSSLDATITQVGARVGTPKYMSPEQAAGKRVDARTDIWSVGMVLFEMLTGERAIEASSPQQAFISVCEFKLDPQRLPADTPQRLIRIMERCLAHKRRERYHHARDLLHDLEDLLHGRNEILGIAGLGRYLLHHPVHLVTTAILVAVIAFGAWFIGSSQGRAGPRPMQGLSSIDLDCSSPALTPAGDRFVYIDASGRSIWIAPVNTGNPQLLHESDRSIGALTITADGQWIYFDRQEEPNRPAIFRIPTSGGNPRRVTDGSSPAVSQDGRLVAFLDQNRDGKPMLGICRYDGSDRAPLRSFDTSLLPISICFTRDGQHIMVLTTDSFHQSELIRVAVDTGESEAIAAESGNAMPGIVTLPDDSAVLWGMERVEGDNTFGVSSLDGGTFAPVFPSYGSLRFPSLNADGSILMVQSSDVPYELVEVPVSPGSGQPATAIDPIPLSSGFNQPRSSPDRRWIVFTTAGADLWLYDRQKQRSEHLVATGHAVFNPDWSPEGDRVVYAGLRGDQADLWVVDARRKTASRLTNDQANDFNPCWHPAGEHILWVSDRDDSESIYRLNLQTNEIKRLSFDTNEVLYPTISPDGRFLAYVSRSQNNLKLKLHRLTKEIELGELVWQYSHHRQGWAQLAPRFSPDGKWFAFDVPLPNRGADFYTVAVESLTSDSDPFRLTAMPLIVSTDGRWDWIGNDRIVVSISRRHDRLLLLREADLWIGLALGS
jgi:Tol biopolymer transport system component